MFLLKIQKIFCFLMKGKLEYIMFFTFNNGFTSIKFDYSWLHIPDFINRFWKFIPSAMIVIKISKLRHCIAITISFIVEAYLKKLLHILSKCWIFFTHFFKIRQTERSLKLVLHAWDDNFWRVETIDAPLLNSYIKGTLYS